MSIVTDFFWCVVGFFQTYNGAVTAIATVFIGAFTGILVWVTNRQARLTRDSIKIANREFVSTHRPKIIVRNVSIPLGYVVDHPISINFTYINIGDTPAKIDVVEAVVFLILKDSKIPRNMSLTCCNFKKRELFSGDSDMTSQSSAFILDYDHSFSLQSGNRLLCIVGCIYYSDDNGVRRTTGFARSCDVTDTGNVFMGFNAVNDPEYEYAY
ncbi:MAG: hypothetical protein ACLPID_19520 [Beijerinckiaceae bacterium]